MINYNNSLHFQRTLWLDILKRAKIIIDGTCGNGHDLLYLYKKSLKKSHIYTFDIQENALQYSKERLLELSDSIDRVKFICDDHKNMGNHDIPVPYDLVVFNLGYLPKGDHAITTKAESTILAISTAMSNLAKNGLITIVAYPGTPYGEIEKDKVNQFLQTIPQKEFDIAHWKPINQKNNPPELFIISRR